MLKLARTTRFTSRLCQWLKKRHYHYLFVFPDMRIITDRWRYDITRTMPGAAMGVPGLRSHGEWGCKLTIENLWFGLANIFCQLVLHYIWVLFCGEEGKRPAGVRTGCTGAEQTPLTWIPSPQKSFACRSPREFSQFSFRSLAFFLLREAWGYRYTSQ